MERVKNTTTKASVRDKINGQHKIMNIRRAKDRKARTIRRGK